MKKTLVALAALAATASFAQSSVSIVGVFDVGYKANSTPNTGGTTTSTQAVATNGVSTSALKFVGEEDIGGGLKGLFLAEINPNLAQSATANQAGSFAADYYGTPFNGEQYVGLSGGFGTVKLGVPNAGFFVNSLAVQPYATSMGSAYGAGGVSRLGTVAQGVVSGIGSGTARIVRHERSVNYVSPSFNGLTVGFTYAAQNDNSTAAGGNQDGYQDINVAYSNGPLNLVYSNAVNKFGNGTIQVIQAIPYQSAATNASATLVNGDFTYNLVGGNYTFGATTVYAGYTTTKSNGSVPAEDATSWNVAAKYTVGNYVYSGNYTVRTSNLTNVNNAKVIGLGADYLFSKRTSVYYRFELADTNTDSKVATNGGSVTNASMVGIRHAF